MSSAPIRSGNIPARSPQIQSHQHADVSFSASSMPSNKDMKAVAQRTMVRIIDRRINDLRDEINSFFVLKKDLKQLKIDKLDILKNLIQNNPNFTIKDFADFRIKSENKVLNAGRNSRTSQALADVFLFINPLFEKDEDIDSARKSAIDANDVDFTKATFEIRKSTSCFWHNDYNAHITPLMYALHKGASPAIAKILIKRMEAEDFNRHAELADTGNKENALLIAFRKSDCQYHDYSAIAETILGKMSFDALRYGKDNRTSLADSIFISGKESLNLRNKIIKITIIKYVNQKMLLAGEKITSYQEAKKCVNAHLRKNGLAQFKHKEEMYEHIIDL